MDIEKFADSVGIARDYINANGQYTTITTDARTATLEAMGYNVHDLKVLTKQGQDQELRSFKDILEPVTVIRDGQRPFIMIKTPEILSNKASLRWTLTLEDGTVYKNEVSLNEIEIADYVDVQGHVYDIRRFILPNELPRISSDLPWGYHHFVVTIEDVESHYRATSLNQLLIRAPLRCYVPDEMMQGKKIWGASVQLYTLRSRQNWGVGDFHDLKYLLKIVHDRGGEFVGLNPMHAGYPANPDPDMVSPYSPSSRRWLNVIYISIPDVPEYQNCKKAGELVRSPAFVKKLQALRAREYVDYKGVLELKLKVLQMIFENANHLEDKRANRAKKFLEFLEKGGESLLNMATYDALQSDLYAKGVNASGWQIFPREYRDCNSLFVNEWRERNKEKVRFYCYLQFLAQEQMEDAFASAKQSGMLLGTYRDLAVGVSEGSCDVWADTDNVYRGSAKIGAPPDTLGPLGQNWGLAPMEPHALRRSQYRSLIELYRANMKSCGALRIDHAAGLYRFWWVPDNHTAVDGAYVYNNINEWLGIIALESQRNQCLIIAEDLGTIPDELRTALAEAGAFSYKLFFGERAGDGGFIAPQDYVEQALSALTTHDMPTLIGWWSNYDLSLGQELGIYSKEDAERLGAIRDDAKQQILNSLHGLGSATSDVPRQARDIPAMTPELIVALEKHMCRGSCALFSSQIEDWTGVLKPVNVPGTFREYPNWRRKLTQNLEDIEKDSFVRELTAEMTAGRAEASVRKPK